MPSQAWKDLERHTAKALDGERISRGEDFSVSTYDVRIPDFDNLKVDCKYRKSKWAHHTHLNDIDVKYCKANGDIPVLVTKNHYERGSVISLRTIDFAQFFLDEIRRLRGKTHSTPED